MFDAPEYPYGVVVVMARTNGEISIERNVTEFHWMYETPMPFPRFAVESDIRSEGGTYQCNEYIGIHITPDTSREE